MDDDNSSRRTLAFLAGYLTYRGACTYTRNLAKGCAAAGHDVHVFCAGGPLEESLRETGVTVHVHEAIDTPSRDLMIASHLAEAIKEVHPDLIHVHRRENAELGGRVAAKAGLPYFLTFHNQVTGRVKITDREFAGSVAASDSVRETAVNDGRVPGDLVRVIRSGIDPDMIKPNPVLQNADIVPTIGAFGPMERKAEYQGFIGMAQQLLDQKRSLQFLLAGQGDDVENVNHLVAENPIYKDFLVLPAAANYYDAMRSVDVVVSTLHARGLGISIMEAMAFEKPVVATAAGGIFDVIQDGETGFLVSKDDTAALVEKVGSHPDEARKVGAAARAFVVEHFHYQRMTEQTLAYFEEQLTRYAG
jgi:glycosyltransferase involved in cell wall biosynthesis